MFHGCYFSVGVPNPVPDIDTGAKTLIFAKMTMLPLLFLPGGGPNSIANFDLLRSGGMAGFAPPLDPPRIGVSELVGARARAARKSVRLCSGWF